MRFLHYIQEEYIDSLQGYAIYKNPSPGELSDLIKFSSEHVSYDTRRIRFIADNRNENIFVAHEQVLHSFMYHLVKKSGYRLYDNYCIYGIGEVKGRIKTTGLSDKYNTSIGEFNRTELNLLNWKWADKYFLPGFTISDYLKTK